MNRDKAKLVLQSYRPGGQDRDDPQFAEALALTEQDPQLKQWFEEQRELDQAMSASLQGVPVPALLKEQLLAQIKRNEAGQAVEHVEQKWRDRLLQFGQRVLSYPILTLSKPSGASIERPAAWNWRPALAVAAGLFILAGGAWWWNTRPTTFTAFCQQITEDAWGLSPHLQFESRQISQVRAWLAGQQVQTSLDLPAVLQNAPLRGCSIVEWRGQKIPVLCLLEGSCHMHLMVVEGLVVTDCPPENQPELLDFGLIRTASWRTKERTYVLTGMNVRHFVKKFRQGGHWNLTS